jgi:hypothetical protein
VSGEERGGGVSSLGMLGDRGERGGGVSSLGMLGEQFGYAG